jgi:hypothetical protein
LEQQAAREYAKAPDVGNQISAWSIVYANALKSMIALSLRLRLSPSGGELWAATGDQGRRCLVCRATAVAQAPEFQSKTE